MTEMDAMIDGRLQKRRIERADVTRFYRHDGAVFDLLNLPQPEHSEDEIVCQTIDGQTIIAQAK